jgi:hypothetical protein
VKREHRIGIGFDQVVPQSVLRVHISTSLPGDGFSIAA